MTNIIQKQDKNKTLGRYATKLPKFLASVFSNPRLTCASTTLFCEILALGVKDGTLSLTKKNTNVSYIKNTVVPFLAKLKNLDDKAIFESIHYKGNRTVSFSLSETIYNGLEKSIETNNYISVNLDELGKLRGKYAKQIYLLLCNWRREKTLTLGFKQVNKLFSLPKSCMNRFSSVILEPGLAQINKKTNLQTQAIQTTQQGWTVFFYRKTKDLEKVKKILLQKDKTYLERKRARFWGILQKKTPKQSIYQNYVRKMEQKRDLQKIEKYLKTKENTPHLRNIGEVYTPDVHKNLVLRKTNARLG